MIVPRFYEDLTVLHQNAEPVHASFTPVSPRFAAASSLPAKAPGCDISASAFPPASDRVTLLSGCKWHFRYFPDIHELKDSFY